MMSYNFKWTKIRYTIQQANVQMSNAVNQQLNNQNQEAQAQQQLQNQQHNTMVCVQIVIQIFFSLGTGHIIIMSY